jgi:hypothetical protein
MHHIFDGLGLRGRVLSWLFIQCEVRNFLDFKMQTLLRYLCGSALQSYNQLLSR